MLGGGRKKASFSTSDSPRLRILEVEVVVSSPSEELRCQTIVFVWQMVTRLVHVRSPPSLLQGVAHATTGDAAQDDCGRSLGQYSYSQGFFERGGRQWFE